MRISDWSSDVCSSDLLRLHVGEVDVEDARRRPVLRRVAVMRLGRRLLAPRLDRTHLDRRLRQMSEQLALPRADFAQQRIRLGDIGSAARVGIEVIEARVAKPRSEERRVGKEWCRTCGYRGR